MKYNMPRHRVFVSCDERDEKFKARIAKMKYFADTPTKSRSIFLECSFTKFVVSDNGEEDRELIQKVRQIDLVNSSVLILLCGKNTKNNVQIDWQLCAAMDEKRPLAIVIINLPTIAKNQGTRAGEANDAQFTHNLLRADECKSREEYAAKYPYLPQRLLDNLASSINDSNIFSLTIVDWEYVNRSPYDLKQLISFAYMRVHLPNTHYDNNRPILREVR